METQTLQRAMAMVRARLAGRARILAAESRGPTELVLHLEMPPSRDRFHLVIDVAREHGALHLARGGAELDEIEPSPLLAGLGGVYLRELRSGADPRVAIFELEHPTLGKHALVIEWIGRLGNARLLDAEMRVLEQRHHGRLAVGDRYAEPEPAHRRDEGPEDRGQASQGTRSEFALLAREFPQLSRARILSAWLRAPSDDRAAAREELERFDRGGAADPDSEQPLFLYQFPRVPEVANLTPADRAGLELEAAVVVPDPLRGLEKFLVDLDGKDAFDPLARAYRALKRRALDEERRRARTRFLAEEMRRLLRLRGHLRTEQGADGDGPRLRQCGEAILAHFAEIRRGDTEYLAPNYAGGESAPPIRIPLDPAKGPNENAEQYFRKARRWERGEPHRKKRLAEIDRACTRLSLLESKLRDQDSPSSAPSFAAAAKEALGIFARPLPRELTTDETPPAKRRAPRENATRPRSEPRRTAPVFRPRSYSTKDGWTVWVGRSNIENDHVTHHLAHPADFWFHAHGVPGSHVVLRREGRKDNPSAKTLEEVAAIAAFFSKARHSSKAPVIYTLKKYVRKPRKAKAGLAVVTHEKLILVPPRNPDADRVPEWMEDDDA